MTRTSFYFRIMSTHVALLSLLKRTPCRVNITQVRSFTKFHHHVTPHHLLSAARPHIRKTPCLVPNFVFQKHQQQWTSTTSATTPPPVKKEDRIVYNSWLDHLPKKIAPYAYLTRIDKPIGTWLLFWPCGTYDISRKRLWYCSLADWYMVFFF